VQRIIPSARSAAAFVSMLEAVVWPDNLCSSLLVCWLDARDRLPKSSAVISIDRSCESNDSHIDSVTLCSGLSTLEVLLRPRESLCFIVLDLWIPCSNPTAPGLPNTKMSLSAMAGREARLGEAPRREAAGTDRVVVPAIEMSLLLPEKGGS